MSASCVCTVRGLCLGQGRPKICVPLVSRNLPELLQDARELCGLPADLAEWRADCFEGCQDSAAVLKALEALRQVLGDKPLLFTCRTKPEGGNAGLDFPLYRELNLAAARSGHADLLDLELFSAPEEELKELIDQMHQLGRIVVVSSHDFEKTPPEEEILRRLLLAKRLGADLPKVAVMPHSQEDVLSLLGATLKANRQGAAPVITMSMGALGGISRLSGEVFGSALTFGCARQASAPGQFPAGRLDEILEALHQSW